MKNKFNPYERAILHSTYSAQRPLSTRKIAERCGISQTTAKKYLSGLHTRNLLTKKERGNRTLWKLNIEEDE